MKQQNLCLECPVRGRCCYLSEEIEGYNIILDFQPCKHLNVKTGLCKVYKHRDRVSYCRDKKGMFNSGSLPAECLYLKGKKEKKMKVNVQDVYENLTNAGKQIYTFMNNHPKLWELYTQEVEKGNVYNALL